MVFNPEKQEGDWCSTFQLFLVTNDSSSVGFYARCRQLVISCYKVVGVYNNSYTLRLWHSVLRYLGQHIHLSKYVSSLKMNQSPKMIGLSPKIILQLSRMFSQNKTQTPKLMAQSFTIIISHDHRKTQNYHPVMVKEKLRSLSLNRNHQFKHSLWCVRILLMFANLLKEVVIVKMLKSLRHRSPAVNYPCKSNLFNISHRQNYLHDNFHYRFFK